MLSHTALSALRTLALLACVICCAPALHAYSVLTHEEVVDMAWKDYMVPLLRERYPGLTQEQIREAHSYAYGGSLIQDLGYYPFGNRFFSDMLHYVRTGDFVEALLRDATNADELAFALGALAHYTSDTVGHPYVNHLVALQFPRLEKKFGDPITYEQSKSAHIRTEFGLDVAGVAKGFYTQEAYRDFVGFNVARPLLDRAFEETYGLRVADLLHDEDHAIRTYRWAVCELIPRVTKSAAKHYADDIEKAHPGYDRKKFQYRMSRTEFEKNWKGTYQRPGWKTRFLAFLVKVLPKIGPLKILKARVPDADQQTLYFRSVNETTDHLIASTKTLRKGASAPPLSEINLDTGKPTAAGQYDLSDATYADLLDRIVELGKTEPNRVPMELRANLQRYFAGAPKLIPAKDKTLRKKMQDGEIATRLELLKQMPTVSVAKSN
ncbi:MAG: zinc dependent phospholipase C family protein [Acidobacteria bacterium]|nr:zinc dependent phospholipase C family protein [Acidobacteriota bacterium]